MRCDYEPCCSKRLPYPTLQYLTLTAPYTLYKRPTHLKPSSAPQRSLSSAASRPVETNLCPATRAKLVTTRSKIRVVHTGLYGPRVHMLIVPHEIEASWLLYIKSFWIIASAACQFASRVLSSRLGLATRLVYRAKEE